MKQDDTLVSPNHGHPLMEEAAARLEDLAKFMRGASEPFTSHYTKTHEHQFSIKNRDFWETNLGL